MCNLGVLPRLLCLQICLSPPLQYYLCVPLLCIHLRTDLSPSSISSCFDYSQFPLWDFPKLASIRSWGCCLPPPRCKGARAAVLPFPQSSLQGGWTYGFLFPPTYCKIAPFPPKLPPAHLINFLSTAPVGVTSFPLKGLIQKLCSPGLGFPLFLSLPSSLKQSVPQFLQHGFFGKINVRTELLCVA